MISSSYPSFDLIIRTRKRRRCDGFGKLIPVVFGVFLIATAEVHAHSGHSAGSSPPIQHINHDPIDQFKQVVSETGHASYFTQLAGIQLIPGVPFLVKAKWDPHTPDPSSPIGLEWSLLPFESTATLNEKGDLKVVLPGGLTRLLFKKQDGGWAYETFEAKSGGKTGAYTLTHPAGWELVYEKGRLKTLRVPDPLVTNEVSIESFAGSYPSGRSCRWSGLLRHGVLGCRRSM